MTTPTHPEPDGATNAPHSLGFIAGVLECAILNKGDVRQRHQLEGLAMALAKLKELPGFAPCPPEKAGDALNRIADLRKKYPGWSSEDLFDECEEIAGEALSAMSSKQAGEGGV